MRIGVNHDVSCLSCHIMSVYHTVRMNECEECSDGLDVFPLSIRVRALDTVCCTVLALAYACRG